MNLRTGAGEARDIQRPQQGGQPDPPAVTIAKIGTSGSDAVDFVERTGDLHGSAPVERRGQDPQVVAADGLVLERLARPLAGRDGARLRRHRQAV